MKRNFIMALAIFFCLVISSTAGAGYLGAPEPIAKDAGVSLGVGYSFLSSEVEFNGSDEFTLKQNQVYAQFSAAYRGAEGYIRVGGSDLQLEDAFATSLPGATLAGFGNDFKDDSARAFLTLGAKYKFDLNKYFSLGPVVQLSIFDDYEDKTTGTVNGLAVTQKLEIDGMYRVDAALLFQLNFRPVHIYAGPYIYWLRADVKSSSLLIAGDEMEETGNFGGAAGVRIKLPFGLNLEVEGQYAEKFSVGGLISYAF